MKQWRGITIISIVCLMFFIQPHTIWSQPKKSLTDQLSQEADVIVVGNVGQLTSEWDAAKSRIQTRVRISVEDMLKGDGRPQSITVVVPGGEVDGVGEWYSHTTRFVKNEDVVVFAKKDPRGQLRIALGQQGKFTIKKDQNTGARIIPNVGNLNQLTSHIKNFLQSHQVDSKQK